jgi:glycosyltransferase involved in cell wall biosynthesis
MMQTPMVVTDRCEIAEIVKDRVADITPFDSATFAKAMERLLTDRVRYTRYKFACQSLLRETFSLNGVVDKLETLYQRVIDEKRQD